MEVTEEALTARMLSGEPFTWSGVGGSRLADKVIQKLRRKGLIAFKREGRTAVWCATKGGLSKTPLARAHAAHDEWVALLKKSWNPGASEQERLFIIVVEAAIKAALEESKGK
jgi:hypothetical protein